MAKRPHKIMRDFSKQLYSISQRQTRTVAFVIYIYIYITKAMREPGGGVFILVHKSLVSSEQQEFMTKCELLWVKVKVQDEKDIFVGSFYMPHRNSVDVAELNESLQILNTKNASKKQILLAGDFNCPDIDWETNGTTKQCADRPIQQSMIDITSEAHLYQIHNETTREDHLLDLVFASNPSLVKSSVSIPGISDHDAIITDIMMKPCYQSQQPKKCYNYSRANWNGLRQKLHCVASELQHMSTDHSGVQELWNYFHTEMLAAVDTFVPHKLHKQTSSLPWLNNRLRRLLRRKASLYNQAKKSRKWETYKQFQHRCKQEMRRAEWDYTNNIILKGLEKNNTKPF